MKGNQKACVVSREREGITFSLFLCPNSCVTTHCVSDSQNSSSRNVTTILLDIHTETLTNISLLRHS